MWFERVALSRVYRRCQGFNPRYERPNKHLTVILLILGLLVSPTAASSQGGQTRIQCDVHQGPCVADLHGTGVALDIRPKPVKAMRDLIFTLSLTGVTPAGEPFIDLGMPGMNMGPNRVKLQPVDRDAYQGKGIIVRCPSGRRTWKALVTIPGVGKVEFLFDVHY